MPSKKKKYNARFPAGRIKKIMQTDEEVGKVAQAVPVIISRTLELFVESLLTKSMQITHSRNAKTLTPSHMKQCILSESRFDFLKDLVKNIPDASAQEDNENNALFEANLHKLEESNLKSEPSTPVLEPVKSEIMANASTEQSTSTSRTPVIQYGPEVAQIDSKKLNFSVSDLVKQAKEPKLHISISEPIPVALLLPTKNAASNNDVPESAPSSNCDNIPPLIPITQPHQYYGQNTEDNLCIDEDYDN